MKLKVKNYLYRAILDSQNRKLKERKSYYFHKILLITIKSYNIITLVIKIQKKFFI